MENPADEFTANIHDVGRTSQAVGALAQRDGAAVASEQPANDVEQGGLAGPGRAHEGDHLALLDVHVHALEDLEFVGAGTERFGESFN